MKLMFVVSCRDAGTRLLPLLRACKRRGVEWGCFFTGDGVGVLRDPEMSSLLGCASKVVACEHSWSRYGGGGVCPVELGSQTDHSAMIAEAGNVVSL